MVLRDDFKLAIGGEFKIVRSLLLLLGFIVLSMDCVPGAKGHFNRVCVLVLRVDAFLLLEQAFVVKEVLQIGFRGQLHHLVLSSKFIESFSRERREERLIELR